MRASAACTLSLTVNLWRCVELLNWWRQNNLINYSQLDSKVAESSVAHGERVPLVSRHARSFSDESSVFHTPRGEFVKSSNIWHQFQLYAIGNHSQRTLSKRKTESRETSE